MNYFAHLYFAKPTVPSHIGNLLGDFRKGVDVASLCPETKRALDNHYVVDRFTDTHEDIKAAKALFTGHTKRFAPVAIDMLFDHFLIKFYHLLKVLHRQLKMHHLILQLLYQHRYRMYQQRLLLKHT